MKKVHWIIVIFMLLLQVQLLYLGFKINEQKKEVVIVDLKEVFEGFTYSKELDEKINLINQSQRSVLDSLEQSISELSSKMELVKGAEKESLTADLNSQITIYQLKRDKFKGVLESTINNFDKKIWNQINAYTKEYCEKENLDIVFGSDVAHKNVLYRKPKEVRTKELLEFINNRYSGAN